MSMWRKLPENIQALIKHSKVVAYLFIGYKQTHRQYKYFSCFLLAIKKFILDELYCIHFYKY